MAEFVATHGDEGVAPKSDRSATFSADLRPRVAYRSRPKGVQNASKRVNPPSVRVTPYLRIRTINLTSRTATDSK